MNVNLHRVFTAIILAFCSHGMAQNLTTDWPAKPVSRLVIAPHSAATIVVPANPSEEMRFAAELLQTYVAKMTDVELPIAPRGKDGRGNRIVLGQPDQAEPAGVALPDDLGQEGYVIKSAGDDLFIVGGSDRGTLFGVCGLLEDYLGVRWYVPGDPLGECIPKRAEIVLTDVNEAQTPSFPMRWVGKNSDWGIRNRQNGPGETFCAGFQIEPGIYHTQNALLPHRDNFATCPEYFAMIRGERSRDRSCKLCYSNPDVVRRVAQSMADILQADPEIGLVSFSPTDGQLWCECDGCRAMDEKGVPVDQSKSRRSLLFYNALASELRKTHPDAKILIGAYNVYNWPPKDADLRADPMLAVIITHYEDYCMAHPVADPTCPLNSRYVQLIEQWEDRGCDVYYYEYYNKGNWSDLPWPIVHSIKHDIPWYRRQGHRGVYTQFSEDNAWTLFPAYYVAAKLTWNADANVDSIVREMADRLFGRAGPAMADYYRVMEESMARCGRHFPGRGVVAGPWVFSDEVLQEMGKALSRAHRMAEEDLVRQRLAKIDLSYDYTCRLMDFAKGHQRANIVESPREALLAAQEAMRVYEGLVDDVVGNPDKWRGVVGGKGALLRPFVRSRVNQLEKRIEQLQADVTRL